MTEVNELPALPPHRLNDVAQVLPLTELVETLVPRAARARWRMPLVCLQTGPDDDSPLDGLAHQLGNKGREVPHAQATAVGRTVPEVLTEAYEGLSQRFGGRPLRFRHFALLRRIMEIDLRDVPVEKRERVLATRLARQFQPNREGLNPLLGLLSGVPAMVMWLLSHLLPVLLLQLVEGRRMRWMLKQRFAGPGTSDGFRSFAVRLTEGARERENPERLRYLLVNAFLQDLRVAYRPGRAIGQRTAHPILLLDGISTGNAGAELLASINHIRNGGDDDPLVVIAAGTRLPCPPVATLAELQHIHRAWSETIDDARRHGDAHAWYLPVEMPGGTPGRWNRRILPPRQIWYTRRPVLAGALVVALLAAAPLYVPPIVTVYRARAADCLATGAAKTRLIKNECVGYSESAGLHFGRNEKLVAAQQTIFDQNLDAERRWQARPSQPRIKLVYLTTLTRPDQQSDDETFVAEREGLQGMAEAQERANIDANNNTVSPYVQIVIANAGQQAQYASTVVTMIKELAAADLSVMGVVAAVDSRTAAEKALVELDAAKLPVITPTMTADRIANGSSLFLRMEAPNRATAQLVRRYVVDVLGRRKIFNNYTFGRRERLDEETDLYVNTLRTDLRDTFGDADYEQQFWKAGSSLADVCSDRYDGVVFFGGRYSELEPFLNRIYSDCSGRLPIVVADGSAARYLANEEARAKAPTTLPLAFVSGGYLGSCGRLTAAGPPLESEQQNYLEDVREQCDGAGLGIQAGGWAVLTYDATRLLIAAFKNSVSTLPQNAGGEEWNPSSVRPLMVYDQARRWTPEDPYRGATGPIAFDRSGTAVNRYVSMVCVRNIATAYTGLAQVPFEVANLGMAYHATPPTRTQCR